LYGGGLIEDYTLLQLGDIHYQYIDNSDSPLDLKDKTFPKKLVSALPRPILQTMLKDLIREINQDPIGILICGDLTTYGNLKAYKDCLSFLKKRINPSFFKKGTDKKIFIVPGNHDIDRNLVKDDTLDPKFEPIKKALSDNGFPDIPFPKIIIECYPKNSKRKVSVFSVNSCLGCGEKRHFPDDIKNELSVLIDYKDKGKKQDDFKEICYEKLDTPLIKTDDIDTIATSIKCCDDSCLPIIITHHNILPQRIPRIDVYTELINSGYFRDKLLELNRPILFLHGHIHDDPIEIIQSSINKDGRIICISAPLFAPNTKFTHSKVGFNKIRIVFGNYNMPIGCDVSLYRLNNVNKWKNSSIKIPLRNPQRSIVYADEESKKILKLIDNQMYVADLKEKYKKVYSKSIPLKNLSECLELLNWLGFIEFEQSDASLASRIINRVIP